jgi:hypothetical protein
LAHFFAHCGPRVAGKKGQGLADSIIDEGAGAVAA